MHALIPTKPDSQPRGSRWQRFPPHPSSPSRGATVWPGRVQRGPGVGGKPGDWGRRWRPGRTAEPRGSPGWHRCPFRDGHPLTQLGAGGRPGHANGSLQSCELHKSERLGFSTLYKHEQIIPILWAHQGRRVCNRRSQCTHLSHLSVEVDGASLMYPEYLLCAGYLPQHLFTTSPNKRVRSGWVLAGPASVRCEGT